MSPDAKRRLGVTIRAPKALLLSGAASALLVVLVTLFLWPRIVNEYYLWRVRSATDDETRRSFLSSLVERRCGAAVPHLLRYYERHYTYSESVEQRRSREIASLGESAIPYLARFLRTREYGAYALDIAVAALEALSKESDSAIQALVDVLTNSQISDDWSFVAADTLGQVGAAPVPYLVEALDSKEPRIRARVAQALDLVARGVTSTEVEPDVAAGAVLALSRAVEDSDAQTRIYAVGALGSFGAHASPALPKLKSLRSRLFDETPESRRYLARVLAELGEDEDSSYADELLHILNLTIEGIAEGE